MTDILIKHGVLFTVDEQNRIIPDGALLISRDCILEIGTSSELAAKYPQAEVVDASGMVILPGFVNTHTHLSMTMTRSIADDIEATKWLPVIWAVEKNLTPRAVYAGAMLGIAELIASGTTCFNDHYFYMTEVARAVEQTGMRADLAEGILENHNRKKGQQELERGRQFATDWHGKAQGRIRVRMGPHALYTCSTELVEKAARAAEELGIGLHMHLAESALEMKMVGKKARGETSVQHLDALGILGPQFLAGHALTINEQDIRILSKRGVGVAHCPQAYGKVGGYPFPAVDRWLSAGIHVGLGTDGVASNNNLDLFDEMRFATLARKLFARDGRVLPARQCIRMATIEGARALGLGDRIGSLESGKQADLIFIDFHKPHLYPFHNLPGHLVYSASGADVHSVMVDGRWLMRARQYLTLDLDQVLQEAQSAFEELLRKGGWQATLEEPKASLAAALKLKITQQSLKVMEILVGDRQPEEDETL